MIDRSVLLAFVFALSSIATPALAQQAGDRTVTLGFLVMDPAGPSDITSLFGDPLTITASGSTSASVGVEYFVRDSLGVELHAAGPYRSHYDIPELGRVGTSHSVPVTLSLQYYFGEGKIRPFVGGGASYTHFYGLSTTGTEAGGRAEFNDAFGIAVHTGLDFKLSERSAIRVDARWIDLDTDLIFESVKLGTIEVDPVLYGVSYVLKF